MSCKHGIIILLLAFFVSYSLFPGFASAMTPEEAYFKADKKYAWLKRNPKLQKYRDKWFLCIDMYKDVFRLDPNGPWAAAGMYKSGELYYELYKRSFKASDKAEALDTFKRVINRYPKSRYRKKAEEAIQRITKASAKTEPPTTGNRQEKQFKQAEACYQKLRQSAKKQKYRDQWLSCINKYKAVYASGTAGPLSAEAMYRAGLLYYELYKRSGKKSDRSDSLTLLTRTAESYPTNKFGQEADDKIYAITGKKRSPDAADAIQQIIKDSSVSREDNVPTQKSSSEVNCTVQDLRHWSNPSYTRVVIDATSATSYQHRLLDQDPTINKPKRLYIDLDNSRLGQHIEKVVTIDDNLLSKVRAGQHTATSVRVVVDIKSFKTYKIFSLRNPFRIVIDVWGIATAKRSPPPSRTDPTGQREKMPPGALAKQLALGVSRIVIDPGHGGRDYGAPGYYKGVHEKHITLAIAKKLARKIRKELSCEVFLTRETDKYLTLEERTAIANTKNADLFISIHTNSARDRRAYGIETFILNFATDEEAIRIAAFENATSEKNISDLETILNDLMQYAKINESSRLASHVQKFMNSHLKKRFKRIRNKGVKQAPFYVLLGAQMPAILVETSFISNPRECKRLTDPQYQEQLCDGIINGIREYIKETNPTAFFQNRMKTKDKG